MLLKITEEERDILISLLQNTPHKELLENVSRAEETNWKKLGEITLEVDNHYFVWPKDARDAIEAIYCAEDEFLGEPTEPYFCGCGYYQDVHYDMDEVEYVAETDGICESPTRTPEEQGLGE